MTVLHYTCCTISLVHITYMTFFAVSGVKMCPVFNAMQHQLLNAVNSNAMQCNAMQCNAMQCNILTVSTLPTANTFLFTTDN